MSGTTLVTGGCGFIGSNLVARLRRGGSRVRVLDLRSSPALAGAIADDLSSENDGRPAGELEYVIGDVRDGSVCIGAVAGVDTVVHLAAEAGILPSIQDPAQTFSVNVVGTLNLLLAAREAGIRRFIFASSGAVLGKHAAPGDEQTRTQPVSPYGASKLASEAYCVAFGAAYGMSTVVLRFSNVYGPGSAHKRSVVAEFCKRAVRGRPPVVYGDGTQSRDFLYVDDLTAAIGLCIDTSATGVFQIASGVPVLVIEVAGTVQELHRRDFGTSLAVEYASPRPFEVHTSYYRIDKARRELGFAPSVDIRKGVERTWRWFRDHSTGSEAADGSSE